MKKKIAYEIGSGNVFADLQLPNADETLVRAELARQICSLINNQELTQKEAALLLGVDQPKISALMNGKLPGFSLERLFRFLNALGQDVTIQIMPIESSRKTGLINISEAKLARDEPVLKQR